jgi:hypothetical protein
VERGVARAQNFDESTTRQRDGLTMLDEILTRFVKHAPISVMAQLGLERVLEPNWMDELFEEHRSRQYQRELLFSTTVDIAALVALGLRPSVRAAARAREDLGVSEKVPEDPKSRSRRNEFLPVSLARTSLPRACSRNVVAPSNRLFLLAS